MNESVLKALMRMFAIIANGNKDDLNNRSRTVVESYLGQQLSQEQLNEYLALFDEFLAFHHRDMEQKEGEKVRKRTSSNSVKVLMICEQINEELQQKEKMVVLLRMLEFINEGEGITEKELDFVKTVSETFKISDSEYENIKSFIFDSPLNIPEKENLIVVNGAAETENLPYKYLQKRELHGNIFILNIESTNTYIFRYVGEDDLYHNGRNVLINRVYFFDKGSSIRSSKISPVYYSDVVSKFLSSQIKQKIIFTAKEIEFRFKASDNGIHNFSFSEESGQLIGIMGGSGVGKSTLLNVLNGNLPLNHGAIFINGWDINKDKDKLEGVIGFVPQDDLLIEELTVFQNLYFNAKLCFSNFSEKKIIHTVAKVLVDLDLIEIKHLTVGNSLNKFISGGQRKRLNIALELIREPSVLFVDEPTSGLSSRDSEMVMDLLKEQTLKGKLVIVNIHQPSSDIYKLFDKLLIMDKGGRPIYYGDPIDAITYFKKMTNHVNADESNCLCCGNVNPEQILQILEARLVNEFGKLTRNRKISPQEWYDLYKKNIEAKELEALPDRFNNIKHEELPKNFFKVPNKLSQFKIFGLRDVLAKLTNKQYLLINFLEAPLLALILSFFTKYIAGVASNPNAYVFSENENLAAYLFMSVVVALFMGLTVSAEEIIRDRKIIQRESFLHLSRWSYLNSKTITMFIISAIQMLTFVAIGNTILEIKGMYFSYWLVLFTTACFANLLGLNISSALNSVVTIYILIPFILVPQLLLSGTIVKFEKLHKSLSSYDYVPFVGDIMTSRWAYEAVVVNQFKNNEYQKYFFDYEMDKSYYGFRKNYLVNELQSRINVIQKNYAQHNNKEETIKNIDLIANELKIIATEPGTHKMPFQNIDKLTLKSFPSIQNDLISYLDQLSKYYSKKYDDASNRMDKQFNDITSKFADKDTIFRLKQKYHNTNIADLVLNNQELKKIIEHDGRFVQLSDPIYKYPESSWGRAHFYAPVKKLGKFYIDTYWFNVLAIWMTTLFLYIALLNDWLRRLIEAMGNFKIKTKWKKQVVAE